MLCYEFGVDVRPSVKPLLGELVFVGGSTTALLITDKAAVKIDIQAVRILAPIWNQVHDLGRNVRISIWF